MSLQTTFLLFILSLVYAQEATDTLFTVDDQGSALPLVPPINGLAATPSTSFRAIGTGSGQTTYVEEIAVSQFLATSGVGQTITVTDTTFTATATLVQSSGGFSISMAPLPSAAGIYGQLGIDESCTFDGNNGGIANCVEVAQFLDDLGDTSITTITASFSGNVSPLTTITQTISSSTGTSTTASGNDGNGNGNGGVVSRKALGLVFVPLVVSVMMVLL